MASHGIERRTVIAALNGALDELAELAKQGQRKRHGHLLDSKQRTRDVRDRTAIILDALLRLRTPEQERLPGQISLFLSWSHDCFIQGRRLDEIVEPLIKEAGVEPVIARPGGGRTRLVTDVRERIDAADVLLCLMTPAGPGDQEAPSPWLIAEIAMAAALGKPFMIIVHERVDPQYWKKVAGEYYHEVCRPEDSFEDTLEARVRRSVEALFLAAIAERKQALHTT